MTFARRTFAWALTVAALASVPRPARAQRATRLAQVDSASRATSVAALVAERQRVRAELERANADVDALKHADRSLRDDYRLRARLADAEALARQLTALDARLGGAAASPGPTPPSGEPRVLPNDGPAELDAKADILSDQARRLAARADLLLGRASDLRARQALRRRVGQMERDPFAPLEGSKRRAMTAGVAIGAATPPSRGTGAVGGDKGVPAPAGETMGQTTGQATVTTTPVANPGVNGQTGAVSPMNPAAAAGPGLALTGPKTAPTASSTSATSDGVALSVQLRDLLDPTTLAELRQLEATGRSPGGLDALERAAAVLKARAARLDQQASALRAAEHPSPRAR